MGGPEVPPPGVEVTLPLTGGRGIPRAALGHASVPGVAMGIPPVRDAPALAPPTSVPVPQTVVVVGAPTVAAGVVAVVVVVVVRLTAVVGVVVAPIAPQPVPWSRRA